MKTVHLVFVVFVSAVFGVCRGDTSVPSAVSREGRVLRFPAYSLGSLYIQDDSDEQKLYRSWWGNEGERDYLAPAKGKVTIPAGKRVILIISSDVWTDPEKLDALKQLKPDDLYNLTISPGYAAPETPPPTDACIPYITHLTGLKTLDLSQAPITLEGLRQLSALTSLERLFTPEGLTDRGLSEIVKMHSLQELFIGSEGNNRLTGRGFALLQRLRNLKVLGLADPSLTNDALRYVARLETLEFLSLRPPFSDEGLQYLTACPRLKILYLHQLNITDTGLQYVSQIGTLEEVYAIWIDTITDQGIRYLAKLPRLKRVDAERAKLTDESLRVLSRIQTLETLRLPAQGITDEGVRSLAALTQSKQLLVGAASSSLLTDQSLKAISTLDTLEELVTSGRDFTDEGMKYISRLKSLKYLCISTGPNITDAGFAELVALKDLEHLTWSRDSRVTIAGLNRLNGLKKLKSISFGQITKGDATLDISGMENLESITLSLARKYNKSLDAYEDPESFSEEDWACFKHLKKLQTIQISGKGVGDKSLSHLQGLPNLVFLNIFGPSEVTDEGLKHLVGKKKLTWLTIADGYFTDNALKTLAAMEALETVKLSSDTAFSNKAIDELKAKKKNWVRLDLKP